MLPDTGERYLSTPLFEGISDGARSGALNRRAGRRSNAEPPDRRLAAPVVVTVRCDTG